MVSHDGQEMTNKRGLAAVIDDETAYFQSGPVVSVVIQNRNDALNVSRETMERVEAEINRLLDVAQKEWDAIVAEEMRNTMTGKVE